MCESVNLLIRVVLDVEDLRAQANASMYGGTQCSPQFPNTNCIPKCKRHCEIGSQTSETKTVFCRNKRDYPKRNRILKLKRCSETGNAILKSERKVLRCKRYSENTPFPKKQNVILKIKRSSETRNAILKSQWNRLLSVLIIYFYKILSVWERRVIFRMRFCCSRYRFHFRTPFWFQKFAIRFQNVVCISECGLCLEIAVSTVCHRKIRQS